MLLLGCHSKFCRFCMALKAINIYIYILFDLFVKEISYMVLSGFKLIYAIRLEKIKSNPKSFYVIMSQSTPPKIQPKKKKSHRTVREALANCNASLEATNWAKILTSTIEPRRKKKLMTFH